MAYLGRESISSSGSFIGNGPVGQGQAERFIFTATGTTPTITHDDAGLPIGYSPNHVSVYLNGIKQVIPTDVAASNGTTLVFAANLAVGDVVECIALSTFVAATTEGTSIQSTGETGGTKFLREDGDNSSSWQAIDSGSIASGAIDSAHIGNDQIDSQHYAAASIDNEHLADDAVGTDELANNVVINTTGTITSGNLSVSGASADVNINATSGDTTLTLQTSGTDKAEIKSSGDDLTIKTNDATGDIFLLPGNGASSQYPVKIDRNGKVGIGIGSGDASSGAIMWHAAAATHGLDVRVNHATDLNLTLSNTTGGQDTGIRMTDGTSRRWVIYNGTSNNLYIKDANAPEGSGGGFYLAQDSGSWTSESDERFKANWVMFENALDGINSLTKIGSFQRKVSMDSEELVTTCNGETGVRHVGVSAQEVQTIIPEAVEINDEGNYCLKYDNLVPYLCKAIQELSAKVAALESE